MSEPIANVEAAVRELGALPVPVGPQMPDFPPPPVTELEKAHAERARLQGLLAEAVRDAHLARRERDLMRERVSEPFGCRHCGEGKRSHGRQYIGGVGMHGWERPSDEQVKARMLARRAARLAIDVAHDAGRRDRYAKALFEFVNGAFAWEAHDDQGSWLEEADAAIVVADAEQAELKRRIAELEAERHSTNEALDDAVQELRARQTPTMPKPGVTGPDACEGCGSVPEQWCPDCAACEQGCFGGFDGNPCTHANAKWGGAR